MTTTFKIHPAIGVARVGDSDDYYIGPDTAAGLPINPDGRPFTPADFRDADGKLKRQAARFTVYRYNGPDDPGTPISVKDADIEAIIWTVHVANKKASWYEFHTWEGEHGYAPTHPLRNADVTGDARRSLIIDPGPRTLNGPNQRRSFSRKGADEEVDLGGYPVSFPPEDLRPNRIDTLGDALTDDEGRLCVLGGHGLSGTTKKKVEVTEYANNDGWFDDTSDGPISARVILKGGGEVAVTPSWVLVGPPSYAPEIENMVTLHDTIFDMFVREAAYRPEIFKDGLWNRDYRPSFADEIAPILRRPLRYNWVVNIPNRPHTLSLELLGDPDPRYDAMRQYYLGVIRGPDDANRFASGTTGMPMMPYLAGDGALEAPKDISRYQTLTKTQYFLLQQWAAGKFTREPSPASPKGGAALDKAVLDNCVGAAFSPGIEMTWISRQRAIYMEPFRIHPKAHLGRAGLSLGEDFAAGMEPGDVTRYMAVPWQADFNECSIQNVNNNGTGGNAVNWVWWWPAQRPLMVFDKPEAPRQHVAWVGQLHDSTAGNYLNFPDDLTMVDAWKGLGFIMNVGTEAAPNFIEVARAAPRGDGGSK